MASTLHPAPRLSPADVIAAPASPVEAAKREAARRAVDEWVRPGMAVGVGSGSTIVYAIQRLAERVHGPEALDIVCVPTSFQSRCLVTDSGLPLSDLARHPVLDVAIDGADEVDPALNCIKGGGACQTLEKLVAAAARDFVVVVDARKRAARLLTSWRRGVPLEVLPDARVTVSLAIEKMGGVPRLRMAVAKAGPVVTDNGNLVIDADWGGGAGLDDPAALHVRLKLLPGVVETGIFAGMAVVAYVGRDDGGVDVLRPVPVPAPGAGAGAGGVDVLRPVPAPASGAGAAAAPA